MTLPSLVALQAFEAVSRCGSVSAAADELCVTPGAVSRNLKLLEATYGERLVERVGRGIALTARGRMLAEGLRPGFEQIRRASAETARAARCTVLRLRSYTTFATRWLLPRLAAFQVANPDIEVQLTMASLWTELAGLDAAIRLGEGDWGLESHPLIANILAPVAAPRIAERHRGDIAGLLTHPLLSTPHRPDDWTIWLTAAGVHDTSRLRFISMESSAIAYEAAIAGRGVALAQLALVGDDLATGRLVRPLDLEVDRGQHTYRLVWDAANPKADALQRLTASLTGPSRAPRPVDDDPA
ncbi:LysR substrate-binding domain-containing protein [Acuticoccus sediminis]|uniref:LysR substrate-binding domain-containing protein n=1 Tax=Acuticoccus sediminis TaxID=2184697 RepID=UPI001CFF19C5|nr:LysR substrate-binding domain-containing protein [Acuticoccus sediminis]